MNAKKFIFKILVAIISFIPTSPAISATKADSAAMDSMQIAFVYMHQADSVLCALGDSSDLSTLYNNWGNIYAMQGELDIAKAYLQKSIAYCPEEAVPTYFALGGIYLEIDSIEQAEQYFEKAKGPTENPYTHTELFYHLSELEEKKGNINQALAYMRQYADSTEADILARKEINLQEVETLFDRKQMMYENAKLHQKSKSIRSYLIGSLFLLLLLSVFYVYRLGRKNRRIIQLTDELQEQKSHLLEQQMALDSLSCQLKAAQQDNQEELRQKQSEYDQESTGSGTTEAAIYSATAIFTTGINYLQEDTKISIYT